MAAYEIESIRIRYVLPRGEKPPTPHRRKVFMEDIQLLAQQASGWATSVHAGIPPTYAAVSLRACSLSETANWPDDVYDVRARPSVPFEPFASEDAPTYKVVSCELTINTTVTTNVLGAFEEWAVKLATSALPFLRSGATGVGVSIALKADISPIK